MVGFVPLAVSRTLEAMAVVSTADRLLFPRLEVLLPVGVVIVVIKLNEFGQRVSQMNGSRRNSSKS